MRQIGRPRAPLQEAKTMTKPRPRASPRGGAIAWRGMPSLSSCRSSSLWTYARSAPAVGDAGGRPRGEACGAFRPALAAAKHSRRPSPRARSRQAAAGGGRAHCETLRAAPLIVGLISPISYDQTGGLIPRKALLRHPSSPSFVTTRPQSSAPACGSNHTPT